MNVPLSPGQSVRKSLVGWLRTAGLPLLLVGVVLGGGYLLFRSTAPRTSKVIMLIDLDPNRALVAKRIAKEATRHGLEVELSSEPYGALEAMKEVNAESPIDLALVPGGVADNEYPNIRQVAALSQEPLQLLVRPELAKEGVAKLKGKRVCIGPRTASTYFIARDVLAFADLHPSVDEQPGDYIVDETSPAAMQEHLVKVRAMTGTDREKALRAMPDAIFLLSTLPSLLARDLVSLGGYRLVPLPYADAYCLDRIRQSANGDKVRIDRALFAAIDIPPYTYSVDPPVPEKPCRTLATRLLLIAYAPTEPEGVSRLLATIYDGSITGLVNPVPLKGNAPQFPLHSGTERYMKRSEPLLSPELVSSLGKAAGGMGALISGMVAIYGFLRLRQLRRFEAYYKEIRRLELIARGQEEDPAVPTELTARRAYLEERLMDLKSRALQDFSNGGLKGEGLMFGILSLVNDTRASLARLTVAMPQHETPPAA